LKLDLVLPCGESTKGGFLHTLNAVDIATSWCEPVALRKPEPQGSTNGAGGDPRATSVSAFGH